MKGPSLERKICSSIQWIDIWNLSAYMISRICCEVDENCALLSYYAASSGTRSYTNTSVLMNTTTRLTLVIKNSTM